MICKMIIDEINSIPEHTAWDFNLFINECGKYINKTKGINGMNAAFYTMSYFMTESRKVLNITRSWHGIGEWTCHFHG